MMTTILTVLLWFSAPFSVPHAVGDPAMDKEYAVKLLLIGRLAEQIVWSSDAFYHNEGRSFTLGIYGENHPFGENLDAFTKKTLKEHPVAARLYPNSEDLNSSPPDLLFVPRDFTAKIGQLSLDLSNKPVLVIGDEEDAIERGAFVALYVKDGLVKFKLNLPLFRARGFIPSEELQRLSSKQ